MKKKHNGIFTETKVIGYSITEETTNVELVQVVMLKSGQNCVFYQIVVNGDLFVSLDNRAFAFYLLNNFNFKKCLENLNEYEDDFDD